MTDQINSYNLPLPRSLPPHNPGDMHVAPGAHWLMRGLLLQSALDGSERSSAPPSPDAAPAPHAAEPSAAASRQAARALDDDRLRACQVPGCESAPMAARSYLGRCRVCIPHMRADEVLMGGELLRFCQKCVRIALLKRKGPRAAQHQGVAPSPTVSSLTDGRGPSTQVQPAAGAVRV